MNTDEETQSSETPSTETETETSEEETTTSLLGETKEPAEAESGSASEPLSADALEFPEGFTVDEPLRDKFLETMNGEMSSQERANALINLFAETQQAALEADSSAWDKTQNEWQTESKTALGENLQPTLTNISKIMDEYGSPELRGIFELTGAGNNVHVIQFLGKVAEKLVEGSLDVGRPPAAEKTAANRAERMFPSMKG